MTPPVIYLRIMVLDTDDDLWCEICQAACATATTYLIEEDGAGPTAIHRLTWCDTCDHHPTR